MSGGKVSGSGSSTKKMDHITAYLMILPAFVLLLVFVIIPLFMAFQKSFTDWNFYSESQFVGFKNFRLVLTNKLFRQSIVNAIKFVLLVVPTQLIISFLFAQLITNLGNKSGNFVKSAIYIPNVISGVVASVIFLFVLDYRAGIMNQFLGLFGLPRVAFLTHPTLALISVVIPVIWLGFGYNTLVMYAGLLNIPKEYYEAADVDGANYWNKLFNITLPSMKNIFVLLSISLVTGTLQLFDIPFMMTGGGPVNKTLTPMIFLYNNFRSADKTMGLTIAGALLMMIVIAALNSIVFTVIRSEKATDD